MCVGVCGSERFVGRIGSNRVTVSTKFGESSWAGPVQFLQIFIFGVISVITARRIGSGRVKLFLLTTSWVGSGLVLFGLVGSVKMDPCVTLDYIGDITMRTRSVNAFNGNTLNINALLAIF